MTSSKGIARNVFSSWSDLLIYAIIGFLLTPFIINKLGASLYGLWILLGSITGYFGLLNLGVGTAITKYVAEFYTKRKYKKVRNLISTSFIVFCFLAIVVVVVGLIVYFYVDKIFNIDVQFLSDIRIALLILTADMAVSFPFVVFMAILKGLQKYVFLNSTSIASHILRAGFIVFFLTKGYGIVALSLITLCTGLVTKLAIFFYFRFRYREFKAPVFSYDRESGKLIFKYSYYNFIGIIANKLVYYSDSTIIGIFLTSSMITHYIVAWKLIEYAKTISEKMAAVLMPKASEIEARGDIQKMRELFLIGCKASLLISLPILIAYTVLGDIFFKLWIGQDFISSHIYLIVLLIPQIFLISQHTGIMIIYGTARHKLYVIWASVVAVLNIIISILLLKIWGLIGVALGTTIPMFIWGAGIMPYYFRKTIGISIKNYFTTLSLFLLPSAAFSLVLWKLRIHYNFTSLISFFLIVGLCTIIFYVIAYFVSLDRKDRERVRLLIPKRREGAN